MLARVVRGLEPRNGFSPTHRIRDSERPWMKPMVTNVLLVAAILLPLAMALVAVLWEKRQQRRQRRQSPVRLGAAHVPGEQLRTHVSALTYQIDGYVVQLLVVGPVVALVVLLSRIDWSAAMVNWLDALVVAAGIGVTAWNIRRLLPLWRERRQCKDSLRAEVAVAQQLDRLQAQDCRVLHDIPVGNLNIDHVVVGTSAVFAVETKSRRKRGDSKAPASVEFDGKALNFPGWVETKPLEHARTQARWLAHYLDAEVGEAVAVVPVLCLPGWLVQASRDAHLSDVRVINPKTTAPFVEPADRPAFDSEQRNRIVHALFKRYPESVG